MAAACASPTSPNDSTGSVSTGLGVLNVFASPVDVFLDGSSVKSGLTSGSYAALTATAGKHMVSLRPTAGGAAAVDVEMKVVDGRVVSVAALPNTVGSLMAESLEDTNAVVPSGATKLRVLHMAPHAGEIQVWRTQPDYSTPIRWEFPFVYSDSISAIGNPYYQSTVGTWDVRVWTDTTVHKPGDPAQWSSPLDEMQITLGSGEKRTVVVLDRPEGGVKFMVIQ
jgi:hypothetical protein